MGVLLELHGEVLEKTLDGEISVFSRVFGQITDDGETLIVVNMASGELFTVDPVSGEAAKIDLDGVLVHGDGLVRNPPFPADDIPRD